MTYYKRVQGKKGYKTSKLEIGLLAEQQRKHAKKGVTEIQKKKSNSTVDHNNILLEVSTYKVEGRGGNVFFWILIISPVIFIPM